MALAALSLSACGGNPAQSIVPGQSTVADVQKVMGGAPVTTVQVGSNSEKVLKYDKGFEFQTKKKLVVAKRRAPLAHERTLQYWRHRWKDQHPEFVPVKGTLSATGQPRMELRAPTLGMAVLYDPAISRVTEVVEYAR